MLRVPQGQGHCLERQALCWASRAGFDLGVGSQDP